MKREVKASKKVKRSVVNRTSFQEDSKEEVKDRPMRKNPFLITRIPYENLDQLIPDKGSKRTSPESKDMNCCVCYKEIKTQGITDTCKHNFCFDCIRHWSKVFFRTYFRSKTLVLCARRDSIHSNESKSMYFLPN